MRKVSTSCQIICWSYSFHPVTELLSYLLKPQLLRESAAVIWFLFCLAILIAEKICQKFGLGGFISIIILPPPGSLGYGKHRGFPPENFWKFNAKLFILVQFQTYQRSYYNKFLYIRWWVWTPFTPPWLRSWLLCPAQADSTWKV